MKKLTTTLVLAAALSVPMMLTQTALAQQAMGDMKNMDMTNKPMAEAQQTHKASGVVNAFDTKTGAATIAHEAVASLKWPAMTMNFSVQDKSLFDTMVVGQKIDFEFISIDKGYVITHAAVKQGN